MTIAIKPKNVGKLRRFVGVKKGATIPVDTLETIKASGTPAERKRATFALNARKWNHGS